MKNIKWILLAIFIGAIFNVLTTYGTMPKPHEYWDCDEVRTFYINNKENYLIDVQFKDKYIFKEIKSGWRDGERNSQTFFTNNEGRVILDTSILSNDLNVEIYKKGLGRLIRSKEYTDCEIEKRATVRPNGS